MVATDKLPTTRRYTVPPPPPPDWPLSVTGNGCGASCPCADTLPRPPTAFARTKTMPPPAPRKPARLGPDPAVDGTRPRRQEGDNPARGSVPRRGHDAGQGVPRQIGVLGNLDHLGPRRGIRPQGGDGELQTGRRRQHRRH